MKKTHLSLVLILVLLVIGGVFWWTSHDEEEQLDYPEIATRKVLRVVTDYNVVGYYVSTDTIGGFNHDLMQALEQMTGITFEVSMENSLEKCIEGLNHGTYDLIARSIPVNANLKSELSFTQPIVRSRLVLVQRVPQKGADSLLIRSHLNLVGKSVYVPKASPAILRLENLVRELGDTIYIKQDETYEAEHLAMMVASGEIDFAVCDFRVAQRIAQSLPEIDIKTDIGFTHFEAWAVRKESPILLDSLNAWIGRFQQTKDFERMSKKYFNK